MTQSSLSVCMDISFFFWFQLAIHFLAGHGPDLLAMRFHHLYSVIFTGDLTTHNSSFAGTRCEFVMSMCIRRPKTISIYYIHIRLLVAKSHANFSVFSCCYFHFPLLTFKFSTTSTLTRYIYDEKLFSDKVA